jgi:hypothetical protein
VQVSYVFYAERLPLYPFGSRYLQNYDKNGNNLYYSITVTVITDKQPNKNQINLQHPHPLNRSTPPRVRSQLASFNAGTFCQAKPLRPGTDS